MTRMIPLLLCLIGLALVPSNGFAGEEGPFLGFFFGGTVLDESQGSGPSGTFNLDYEPGTSFGGSLGYDLGEEHPAIGKGRVELEVAYRMNDLDRFDFLEGQVEGEGDVTVLSFMLNTFGEHRTPGSPWIPYLGFGLGYAIVTLNDAEVTAQPFADDEAGVFAWQAGAGIGLLLHRLVTLDLGYRYFAAVDPEFTDATGETFESEYASHSLSLGLRVGF